MSQIGYMMLAAGLGVAGYAFAIFHLLTHGFFKANMFLGAGSVMHGMNDDVDMRHYGALRKCMPVTFADLRHGLPRDHRLPAASPASGPRTRSSRPRSTESPVVGPVRAARRRHHRLLHDPADADDVLQKKRWEDGVHPHESPAVMTVPLIVLAALSVLGGLLLLGGWIVGLPGTGRRRGGRTREPPLADHGRDRADRGRRRRRRGLAWLLFGGARCPRTAPSDVSFVTRAARARPLRRRDQRGAGRRARPQPGRRPASAFDRAGVDGAFNGTARGRRRRSAAVRAARRRTASSAPTPCPCSAASCSSSWPCWR